MLCVLTAFGLDPYAKSLQEARDFFNATTSEEHVERTMKLAGVTDIVMTNDVFNEEEAAYWQAGAPQHPKLHAALRMDPLLNDWEQASSVLSARGYAAHRTLDGTGIASARKFIDDWIGRMKPLYMAVSLPPPSAIPKTPSGRA